jgi:hypothetical protein
MCSGFEHCLQSEFMTLFKVFNLWIGPCFIFQFVVNFSIAILLVLPLQWFSGAYLNKFTGSMVPHDWEQLKPTKFTRLGNSGLMTESYETPCFFKKPNNEQSPIKEECQLTFVMLCSILCLHITWRCRQRFGSTWSVLKEYGSTLHTWI